MSAHHHTRQYQACVVELKARGRFQQCITCPKILDTEARRGHPQHMTLGHIIGIADGGAPYDARNYGPQCGPCNYGLNAQRTNDTRYGRRSADLRVSPDWT